MVKTKEIEKEIKLSPIRLEVMNVKVKSMPDSTLLMNKMSDTERQKMLDKVTGKSTEKNKIRDLTKESEAKKHFTETGKLGFPADGFKAAIVEAAPYLEGMNKKLAKSIQVMGGVLPLIYKSEGINKSVTRDSGMTKAPRETWRPEIKDWSISLTIRYNASQITSTQVAELIKLAGFHIGVGAWRPQCSGSHGMFTLA